jgi:hypothetical protein
MGMAHFPWADQPEADRLIRVMAASASRPTATEIAIEIMRVFTPDRVVTKASIVGRARRLGIQLPRRPAAAPEPSSILVRPQPTLRRIHEEPRRFPKRLALIAEPIGEPGLYLLNAAEGDCRRPVNDPPPGSGHLLRVCGDPARDGSRYCTACHAIVYTRQQVGVGSPGDPNDVTAECQGILS